MTRTHSRPTRQNQATRAGLLAILLIATAIALPVHAEPPASASLTLSFTGLKGHQGNLMIALFDSEAAYAQDGKPIRSVMLSSAAEHPQIEIGGLATGAYAIKLYHDVNNNAVLDTNLFGAPTEPYAFSNNAAGVMGPPKWADAVFTIAAPVSNQTITIE